MSELARELQEPFDHLTEKSNLHFEKALQELSLLALEHISFPKLETQPNQAVRKVESSLRWYVEHMTEDPKLDHVAWAVHISSSQLRRIFWQVRRENPLRSFTRLRLQRAVELLSNSDLKIAVIARQCGFSSLADFDRVFRKYHKVSPRAWRRAKLPPYREPTQG